MEKKEEIKIKFQNQLERLRDIFAKKPDQYHSDARPEYYQERLERIEDIFPIFLASKVRRELKDIAGFPSFEEAKKRFEGNERMPLGIISAEDIKSKLEKYGKPQAILDRMEQVFEEFMAELDQEVPSVEEAKRRCR